MDEILTWLTAKMQQLLKISAATLVFASPCVAAQSTGIVESVRFKASITPPVYTIPEGLRQNETLFRIGLQTLPEGLLVVGALSLGSDNLGLSTAQGTNLVSLMGDVYAKIATDVAFSNVSSALPYGFSETKNTMGHYFLYHPNPVPKNPVPMVFLHGYGGNFLFYTWVLKEQFPDAVIMVPSWGVSWGNGSAAYVKEMLADAERRLGMSVRKPWLMAISGGGPAGFRIYNQDASEYAGYVCLASSPDAPTAGKLRKDLRILMVNGTSDTAFPIDAVRKRAKLVGQRVPTLTLFEIKSDHFFLLSKTREVFEQVRKFMDVK